MFSRSPLAVIALVASLSTAPLLAAPFTVNSPSDVSDASAGNGVCETAAGNGVCTLRAAIEEANALAGSDIITLPALPPPNAYVLTLAAELIISSNLTLNGGGATTTIIDGNRSVRPTSGVLYVEPGTVTISGITVRNGGRGALVSGGGITNSATLTLTNSTVSGNTALVDAGGIYNNGTLALNNSSVSGNSSGIGAGGILNFGALTLTNSTVSGNASSQGGGIYNDSVVATTFLNSTVSGNTAAGRGGGLFNFSGSISLFNVTITNNTGNLNLAGNLSAGIGGGIYNAVGAAVTFQNTIILANFDDAGIAGIVANECTGTITSNGNNVMGNTFAGCTVNGGGVTYLDSYSGPYLGPLQFNGGPTRTHALLTNNPALEGGNPLGCRDQFGGLLTSDQRGSPRPSGTNCDAGAFELRDPDSDGIDAATDNCTLVANPDQLDADADGYGNYCDPDLNNSGLTTAADFNLLRSVLNQTSGASALAAAADMNGSGLVTSADYNLLRAGLNQPPGPSGLHP